MDEFFVVAAYGRGECVEHDAVAGGVDAEADAEEVVLAEGEEGLHSAFAGHGDGEDADVGLLDVALVGEFAELSVVVVEVEEGEGSAGFEVVVGFVFGDGVGEGEDELVECVVGAGAQGDRVAAVGFVDVGAEVGGGEGAGVGSALVVELHFEEFGLPLEGGDGVF